MNFKEVLNKMEDTYTRKNKDYGDSFKLSLDEHGLIASIIQMEHKFNRLKNLLKNKQQVEDESVADTLLDLANYSSMTYMWLNSEEVTSYSIDTTFSLHQKLEFDIEKLKEFYKDNKYILEDLYSVKTLTGSIIGINFRKYSLYYYEVHFHKLSHLDSQCFTKEELIEVLNITSQINK